MSVNHLLYFGPLLAPHWWGVGRGHASLDREEAGVVSACEGRIVLFVCSGVSQAVVLFPPSVEACTLLL